ncbi:MAG: type III-A CRISPR-associated RAMP protein Csm3 [Bacteroidetes bacterium]|nr:MAG: type III-A CRISPR-associated RAMP protein Csm3 [Bacteroidota bacterium]
MNKLIAKHFITGYIVAETGLHIGGSKTALDIGGIDLNVIKDAAGRPFIPGSSLKGKLRSLLAREEGSVDVKNDSALIQTLFGSANDKTNEGMPSRLIVRDAHLDVEHFQAQEAFQNLELGYTEGKTENAINRKTGTAEHPRQLERVPSGARFRFEIVYNTFDDGKKDEHLTAVRKAMRLLEDDYLGGQGSRGYGKIRFVDVTLTVKEIADYEGDNQRREVEAAFLG